jgi:hypothetical protein
VSDDAYEAYVNRRREDAAAMDEAGRLILAGLEQVRKTLDLEGAVTYKRMKELRDRILMSQFDFTLQDTYLVGTWMLSSAMSQAPVPPTRALPTPGDFA